MQKAPTEETLVLHLGSSQALDKEFATLDDSDMFAIQGDRRPAATRMPGRVALLAASAEGVPGGGSAYLLVGALHGARITDDRARVKYASVDRFPMPLVVGHSAGPVRDDLLGKPAYWSPQTFYWLPSGAAGRCIAAAHQLVHPSTVEWQSIDAAARTNHDVRTREKLAWFKPVLWNWIHRVNSYASIWSQRQDRRVSGHDAVIEAKHAWLDKPNTSLPIIARRLNAAAVQLQTTEHETEGSTRMLSVVFAAPCLPPDHTLGPDSQKLFTDALVSAFGHPDEPSKKTLSADGIAWCFPEVARTLRGVRAPHNFYPGVFAVVREVPRLHANHPSGRRTAQ